MKSKIINTFLMVSLLILGLAQFKIAFFEQSRFSGPRKSIKLWQYQVNPQPLTQAANNAYLYQGDSDKALHLLQKALTNDPLYIPAWIALSELKVYQGNKKEALAILAYIDRLMIEVGYRHWEKTMLAYQL
ncbi:MAG: tetratricopeptide repeat protein, partial [Deltaproteobacteria bacterium]|nr:tetratricopeptide repeat protein [Deltaproteobacteria bacterium]